MINLRKFIGLPWCTYYLSYFILVPVSLVHLPWIFILLTLLGLVRISQVLIDSHAIKTHIICSYVCSLAKGMFICRIGISIKFPNNIVAYLLWMIHQSSLFPWVNDCRDLPQFSIWFEIKSLFKDQSYKFKLFVSQLILRTLESPCIKIAQVELRFPLTCWLYWFFVCCIICPWRHCLQSTWTHIEFMIYHP